MTVSTEDPAIQRFLSYSLGAKGAAPKAKAKAKAKGEAKGPISPVMMPRGS